MHEWCDKQAYSYVQSFNLLVLQFLRSPGEATPDYLCIHTGNGNIAIRHGADTIYKLRKMDASSFERDGEFETHISHCLEEYAKGQLTIVHIRCSID